MAATWNFDGLAETQPIADRQWNVPANIELDGTRLRWTIKTWKPVRPAPGLFEDFPALADAPAERVLRYAKRWGVLQLCDHGFPEGHANHYWPSRPARTAWGQRPTDAEVPRDFKRYGVPYDRLVCICRGSEEDQPWCDIADWRTWARRAQATLTIAAALHGDRLPKADEWLTALEPGKVWGHKVDLPKSPREARDELTSLVNYWLTLGRVASRLEAKDTRLALLIWSNGLFGHLAVQLSLAACGHGLALCSSCGRGYAPSRRPRNGERCYCETCRDSGAPQRDAARDYRRRPPGSDRRKTVPVNVPASTRNRPKTGQRQPTTKRKTPR